MPPTTTSDTTVGSARNRGPMSRGPWRSRVDDMIVSHNLTKPYGAKVVDKDLSFTVRVAGGTDV